MPSPFQLVSARPWQAKSVTRQLAEMQYEQDRSNAHIAKESWKTQRQLMYNDLANAMDSASMMGEYGPTGWGREMFAMGVANANTAALSTLPPYVSTNTAFPMPLVGHMPTLPALPMMGASRALLPAPVPIAEPVPLPVPVPAPVPALAGAVHPASLVNNIPISVGAQIPGYRVLQFVGPADAIAPGMMGIPVIAVQRLNAVEALVARAGALGGNGVINLRIVTDPMGTVTATGDAVLLVPLF